MKIESCRLPKFVPVELMLVFESKQEIELFKECLGFVFNNTDNVELSRLSNDILVNLKEV